MQIPHGEGFEPQSLQMYTRWALRSEPMVIQREQEAVPSAANRKAAVDVRY
jgi:hypothetical protein